MPAHLILTVGVGTDTRGESANLPAGLVNTLQLTQPDKFWLVPSDHKDSTETSNVILDDLRSRFPDLLARFVKWQPEYGIFYNSIHDPDDLELCRRIVREVIVAARKHDAKQPPTVIVNPTSGTKQMSAGATLAALDESAELLHFTVGKRDGGVVITGTERIVPFDAARHYAERDLRTAEELFQAGAFQAAAALLKPHRSFPDCATAGAKAQCLHEWQRLDYSSAARHAGNFDKSLAERLTLLAGEPPYSCARTGDLLASADQLLSWGDVEEALGRYYRGAEFAAKTILALAFAATPRAGQGRYRLHDLMTILPPASPSAGYVQRTAGGSGVNVGLETAWQMLRDLGHPCGIAFYADLQLPELLQSRHQTVYGHGTAPATAGEVRLLSERLRAIFRAHYPPLDTVWRPTARPASLIY